jgi:hypothetical protein
LQQQSPPGADGPPTPPTRLLLSYLLHWAKQLVGREGKQNRKTQHNLKDKKLNLEVSKSFIYQVIPSPKTYESMNSAAHPQRNMVEKVHQRERMV